MINKVPDMYFGACSFITAMINRKVMNQLRHCSVREKVVTLLFIVFITIIVCLSIKFVSYNHHLLEKLVTLSEKEHSAQVPDVEKILSYDPLDDESLYQTNTSSVVTNTGQTHAALQFLLRNLRKVMDQYVMCLTKEYQSVMQNATSLMLFGEIEQTIRTLCLKKQMKLKANNFCSWPNHKSVGRLGVNQSSPNFASLNREYGKFIHPGGEGIPLNCISIHKVAVVIPFRDRLEHLGILLRQLHPMLHRQGIFYRVFVIEQRDHYPFNRGKLMNVGYKEALRYASFGCFVFHDVDLIPEDDRNVYHCENSPRHLSVAVSKFDYKLPYEGIFGGVGMISAQHFVLINGFSNSYWGWGAEDDDLYRRTIHRGLKISRPEMGIGRYLMLKHDSAESSPDRLNKLERAVSHSDFDGISNLRYQVVKRANMPLYTAIGVDLLMEDDMSY